MAKRTVGRLTTIQVAKAKDGRHADGGGLYLQVRGDSRTWIFRYRDRVTGKEHDMGLGATHTIPLARARELATQHRATIAAGNDPLEYRRRAANAEKLRRARTVTFGECCTRYVEAHRASWRNEKHAAQWSATLATYCKPIWAMPVAEVDTPVVVRCLQAHWIERTETMTRVRQRMEAVLSWATVREFRRGDNPARWRGHLDMLLAKPAKVKIVTPRAALPYTELPAFTVKLRNRQGLAARAVELQILTAARPGEIAGMQWAEVDLEAATWTIPGARMKAGKEHRVPLSARAVDVLRGIPRDGACVFPGAGKTPTLSTAAMLKIAREVRAGIDTHGFRSAFRDWAAERTSYPREVIEAALAHRLKDKAEAAYFRSDLLEKRARLMRDWARFCNEPAADASVTPIKRRAK